MTEFPEPPPSGTTPEAAELARLKRELAITRDHVDNMADALLVKNQLLAQKDELLGVDMLTGLPNQSGFEISVKRAIDRRKRPDGEHFTPASIIFFDIDNFKKYNTEYGHSGGDAVIQHVAKCLQEIMRPGDVVARLHGDEFAMLLYDARTEDAIKINKRAWQKLNNTRFHHKTGDQTIDTIVNISGGVAEITPSILNYEELKNLASKEMLAHKSISKSEKAPTLPKVFDTNYGRERLWTKTITASNAGSAHPYVPTK